VAHFPGQRADAVQRRRRCELCGYTLPLGNWQDALFGLAAASNAVIGVVQQIASKDVVRDDVLVLRAGDQVTADASVIEGVGPRG
jgi:hypothetical protein